MDDQKMKHRRLVSLREGCICIEDYWLRWVESPGDCYWAIERQRAWAYGNRGFIGKSREFERIQGFQEASSFLLDWIVERCDDYSTWKLHPQSGSSLWTLIRMTVSQVVVQGERQKAWAEISRSLSEGSPLTHVIL